MIKRIFLALFVLIMFFIRLHFCLKTQEEIWAIFNSEDKVVEGMLVSELEERRFNIKMELETVLDSKKIKVIAYVQKSNFTLNIEDLRVGDVFEVKGDLLLPEPDSYKKFLASRGVSGLIFSNEIKRLNKRSNLYWQFVSKLTMLRIKFVDQIESILPSPESGLAAGILLGVKKSFSDNLLEKFRHSGLTHIIVLSGFNISIVAIFLIFIFKGLSQKILIPIIIISLIIFSLFVGGGAPVIRSVMMTSLALVSRLLNRQNDVGKYLFLTAIILSILNPLTLLYDPSFQLSFLATFGIIYISPYLQIPFIPLFLREIMGGTLAATLSTAPIIIYLFREISLIGIASNIFVLPIIPLAMALSFVSIFIPFLAPLAYIPLKWIIFIASVFSQASLLIIDFPD